jgi:hypothetical protein
MRWPCDWNRPLSKEERAIAKRLDNAPPVEWMVEAPKGEPISSPGEGAMQAAQEEAP